VVTEFLVNQFLKYQEDGTVTLRLILGKKVARMECGPDFNVSNFEPSGSVTRESVSDNLLPVTQET
jgi:hypothetical protein